MSDDHFPSHQANSLAAEIDAGVRSGALKHDPAQTETIQTLDALLEALARPQPANKKSALGWLFAKKLAPAAGVPRGAYIWGGVGRGKSMLMDMFFHHAPVHLKKRVHFHAFMQDVHGRIHVWRQAQNTSKYKSADPIPPLADDLAKEVRLLCFDEFAVTDVADAMILARLFTGLFERGVTVVATSNVEPKNLYKDGLNRSFFLPFIDLMNDSLSIVELASKTDYRMEKLINGDVYMSGDGSDAKFDAMWAEMVQGLTVEPAVVEKSGRKIRFEQSCGGILRAHFDELCRTALAAGDYLAIADRFHTLALEGIPVMEHADRNAVKRFIALIDTLYDRGMVLLAQAEARPSELYPVDHGTEAFEFDRTISRLREMQDDSWLSTKGGNRVSE
jgi:cell division protein ZapE